MGDPLGRLEEIYLGVPAQFPDLESCASTMRHRNRPGLGAKHQRVRADLRVDLIRDMRLSR
jgi:hypothetical protein